MKKVRKIDKLVLNELIVFVGTWNFAGREPREEYKIAEWLLPLKNTVAPDIYIIGLQEIVDLNTKNIVFVPISKQVSLEHLEIREM